jgi:hypothetical protein
MSNAHIIFFDGGIKPPSQERRWKMIMLLIGVLASTIYGWWNHRHGAH